MKRLSALPGLLFAYGGMIPVNALGATNANLPDKIGSFLYIPWLLLLIAIMVLLFVLARILSFKKQRSKISERKADIWKSILTFPAFIGGLGVTLTVFSTAFYALNGGGTSLLNQLVPLILLCILFIVLCRSCYALLDHLRIDADSNSQTASHSESHTRKA